MKTENIPAEKQQIESSAPAEQVEVPNQQDSTAVPSSTNNGTSTQVQPQAQAGAVGEGRKISTSDIQLVQNLIESCLQLYMSQREVVFHLQQQAKIEPGFTGLVWQKLEEQNPEFFRAYYTR